MDAMVDGTSMIVARSLQNIANRLPSIVTVGTYDGVHLGHQSIIGKVVERAKSTGLRSVVVTFEPHPREVVGRGPVQLLATLDERLELLRRMNVDITLVLNFTYEFSRQTPRQFYEQYLVQGLGVREVIVGYDHQFGRDREAGVEELKRLANEYGFQHTIVGPVSIDGQTVSSSKIREQLLAGNVEQAKRFLGRPYTLRGTVTEGDRRGREIGFPTANLRLDQRSKLIPANGVYFVSATAEGMQHFGMMNIGRRPTFQTSGETTIEVHLFEFTNDIYGASLRVEFLKRLRPERAFSSKEELVAQLERDKQECQKFIAAMQPS